MIHNIKIAILILCFCLAALFPLAAAAPGDGSRIYFDMSTRGFPGFDNQGPAGFSVWKSDLVASGHSVDDTLSLDKSLGTLAHIDLLNYDVFVIVNPLRETTEDEREQITSFVNEGGSLVVICDTPAAIHGANLILQKYNISFKQEIHLNTKIDALPGTPSVNTAIPLNYGTVPVPGADHKQELLPRYEWVEPDGHARPHTINQSSVYFMHGTSNHAFDLATGMEASAGEEILVMAAPVSEGAVIALGTKELLTNYRYDEGRHLVEHLMAFIEDDYPDDDEKWIKTAVDYSPDRLSIPFLKDKVSIFPIFLTNTADEAVTVTVSVSDIFSGLLQPMRSTLQLEPEEDATLYLRFQDREEVYSYILGEISLFASAEGIDSVHIGTIPLEVEHGPDYHEELLKEAVTYSPGRLRITFKEDKVSLLPIYLTNTGDRAISVDVSIPSAYRDLLQPIQSPIMLQPQEEAALYFRFQDREAEYTEIRGEISLYAWVDGIDPVHIAKISFEAEHQ